MTERNPVQDHITGWDRNAAEERFSIDVLFVPTDRGGDLLKLIGVLHRKGIDPLTASLTDADEGRRCLSAAFASTPSRARTAAETLRNVVGVAKVEITRERP
jgi:hypothetical protein